jgi:hypothetical protein
MGGPENKGLVVRLTGKWAASFRNGPESGGGGDCVWQISADD